MTTPKMSDPPAPQPGAWVPILDGIDAVRAESAVLEIAEALINVEPDEPTVAGGSAGIALLFAYLTMARRSDGWLDTTTRLLTHAAHGPVQLERYSSFVQGATGIAWVQAHLDCQLRGQTYPTVDESFERTLLSLVSLRPWPGVHDHSHGLAGCGLYALEARGSPYSDVILERVIDRLNETALKTRRGTTWWTPPSTLDESFLRRYPEGGFNLGLAHGIPSIVAFLAQACAVGVAAEKARRLLDGAMEWLLARRKRAGEGSCYQHFEPLVPRRVAPSPVTVRWCYGDLGVSAAMLWAGITIGEASWVREGTDLALRVAQRPLHGVQVEDACLCHGAAGNGHVFNRFYQATRDVRFLEAARRWLGHALSFHRPGNGVGGFRSFGGRSASGEVEWHDVTGIFGGSAGIGLALLAAMDSNEPRWDQIMMVSMPPVVVGPCGNVAHDLITAPGSMTFERAGIRSQDPFQTITGRISYQRRSTNERGVLVRNELTST